MGQEIAIIYNSLKSEITPLKDAVIDTVSYYLEADLAAQNRGLLEVTYNTDYEYRYGSKHSGKKLKKVPAPGGNGRGGTSEDQILQALEGDTDWVRTFKYDTEQNLNETIGAGERTLASLKSGFSLMDGATKPGSRDFFEMLKILATVTLPGIGTVDLNGQLLKLAYDVQEDGKYLDSQVAAPELKALLENSTKEAYTMISLVRELVKNNPGVEIKFGDNLPRLQIKESRTVSGSEWVDLAKSGTAKGGTHLAMTDEQFKVKADDNGLDYTITVFGKEGGAKILTGKLILAGQEWGIPIPKSAGTVTNSNGKEYIAYKARYFDSPEFKKLFFDSLEKKAINGDFPDPTAASLRSNFLGTRAIYDTLNVCQLESMQRQMELKCEELKVDLNKCKGISEAVTPTVTPLSRNCEGVVKPSKKTNY
ncbi:MAG: hypothetical protein EOP04_20245 [Proteobacteria bacterium]|nr:MAG: hypothetical protein EOP04_20245 [Pseudomonadota bacterium]